MHSAAYEASLLVKVIQKIYKDQDTNNNNNDNSDDDKMSIENEEMSGKVVKDVVIKKYRVVKTFLNKKRNEN